MMNPIQTAARLPSSLEEHDTLAELPIGKSGWTVPWAMTSYGSNGCYLFADYTYSLRPGGTVQMLVSRDEGGYHVVPPSDWRYQECRTLPAAGNIPVATIKVQSLQ